MFENITIYDKAVAQMATLFYIRKEHRKRCLIRKWYFTVLGVLALLCGLILLALFRDVDYGDRVICVLTLVVGPLSLCQGLFQRRLIEWRTLKSLEKRGDSREFHVSFGEDSFLGVRSGMETRYEYEMLADAYETEGFFALRLSNQTWIFLDKAGFTRGTPGGFRTFLEGRLGKPLEFVE